MFLILSVEKSCSDVDELKNGSTGRPAWWFHGNQNRVFQITEIEESDDIIETKCYYSFKKEKEAKKNNLKIMMIINVSGLTECAKLYLKNGFFTGRPNGFLLVGRYNSMVFFSNRFETFVKWKAEKNHHLLPG